MPEVANVSVAQLTVQAMVTVWEPMAVTAAPSLTVLGMAIRPACPTSCCSTSVAPRMPLCICVRFQMVACAPVIFISAVVAAPAITSMIDIETRSSASEKPLCDVPMAIPKTDSTSAR